jgi:serine/threonine protein kinase
MAHPKKLTTAFDEYRVLRVIGEGGTGYVLEVVSRDGTRFAAKYMRVSSLTTDRQRRFKNEIHFCIHAKHEQIVPVVDHGIVDSDGSPFYVMPLFDKTLRQVFSAAGINAQKRFDVMTRVLTGVEAAHMYGVAHRDLKPENILISEDDSKLVIADFGIACFIEAEMATAVETRDATRLANFKYAAPEQLEHAAPGDKRSDIFALGLLLNEAFTGRLARGSEYRRIASEAPDYGYLDDIVETMIRQDPDRRVQSVGSIKEAISTAAKISLVRQKVDQLSRQVVPETEIDDPLLRNPPTLQAVDWQDNQMIFQLNCRVNQPWTDLFTHRGYDSMVMGSSPDYASWNGMQEFRVRAHAHEAQGVQSAYERHVDRTNRLYAQWAQTAHREKLAQEQNERQAAAGKEAERLRVLESLRRPK